MLKFVGVWFGIYFFEKSSFFFELAFDKINLFKNEEQFNNSRIIYDKLIYFCLKMKRIKVWKANKHYREDDKREKIKAKRKKKLETIKIISMFTDCYLYRLLFIFQSINSFF